MSAVIHFTGGKRLEISEEEFLKIAPKLQGSGVRMYRQKDTGSLIPLNSNTIELIEHFEETIVMEEPAPKEFEETIVNKTVVEAKEEESPEEKQKRLEAELFAKSNCKHTDMELYFSNSSKGKRYFPVCTFCGKRERYISLEKVKKGEYEGTPNAKWTMQDIMNAKAWLE